MYSSARHSQATEQHHIAQGHTFKYNIIKFTQKYQTTPKKNRQGKTNTRKQLRITSKERQAQQTMLYQEHFFK
jgi:hypothetical protein